MTDQTIIAIVAMAGAALTMALGAIGAAIGESRIGAAAMDALARQPDEASSITRTLFVSLAMVESTAIFCLVIALILLFANPFIGSVGEISVSPTLTTFLFEAANFLVLAAVLGWLFFKPVRQALVDHREKFESDNRKATQKLAEAEKTRQEIEQTRANCKQN